MSSKYSSRSSVAGHSAKSGKSGHASSVASGSTGTGSKKTSSQRRRSSSSSSADHSDDELDAEDSLESQLVPCLASCSRQKMRAIHMALKRMGNNDNRISSKDFYAILTTEYGIKFTPRVVQIIQETFEDSQGIQFEKIFKCMEGAHQRTGRDSVDAALARNDLQTRKTTKTLQEWTEELITRVEEQVSRADVFLDFEDLRKRMDEKDADRKGVLTKQELMSFCNEPSFPVYGALLNALIKHCESEQEENRIKWQEFVDMLERGQTRFTEANPDMRRALTTRPKGGIIKGSADQAQAKKKGTVKMSVEGTDEAGSTITDEASSTFTGRSNLQSVPSTAAAIGDATESSAADAFDSQQMVKDDGKRDHPFSLDEHDTVDDDEFPDDEQYSDSDSDDDVYSGWKKSLSRRKRLLLQRRRAEDEARQLGDSSDTPTEVTFSHAKSQPSLSSQSHSTRLRRNPTVANPFDYKPKLFEQHSNQSGTFKAGPNQIRVLIDEKTWEEAQTAMNDTRHQVQPRNHHYTEAASATSKGPTSTVVKVVSGTNIESHVQVFRPKNAPPEPESGHAPHLRERLQLQWVYGCRGNDCRSNLFTISNGDLVYFIANIAVIYNPHNHSQRFYRGHTDEIKCMSVHPVRRSLVATGQNGYDETIEYKPAKQACVRVWRGDTLETIAVLGGGMLVKSVLCVTFHPEKDVIAAVDAGPAKYVCLWDFNKSICLTSYQIKVDLICDMTFNPKTPEVFVTCGKDHLSWWKIMPELGTFGHIHDANYQTNQKAKFVICMTHTDRGDLVTGDSNGTIYMWANGTNTISNAIKNSHLGSVYSVCYVKNSIVSSGRDGMIFNWALPTLDKVGDLKLPETEGAVRTIVVRERHFIFATTTNSILVAPVSPGQWPLTLARLNAMPVTQGHYDAVHALTIPRIGNYFLTAGSDGILLLFDASKRRPVFKFVVPLGGILSTDEESSDNNDDEPRPIKVKNYDNFISADISGDACVIALATKDCWLLVLRLHDDELQQEAHLKIKAMKISVVRFSRDAERLAVGSNKGEIFIFGKSKLNNLGNLWEPIGVCYQPGTLVSNTLAVTSIDWATEIISECYFFRVTFHNTEYAIFNGTTCQQVSPVEAADYEWTTSTCLLAWDRAGVFEHKSTREMGVRQLDVHPVRQSCLVVSDYTTNKVTMFRYPCYSNSGPSQSYPATMEVSDLRFTALGEYVISIGGKDSAILQWKVV